ncbi:MAG: hypothetical protein NVS3B21_23360 [Acidimicrobiales bacterium]
MSGEVAAVYGGGALWGVGFGIGVASALCARGVPLANAPSLGTSAGSWVAAAIHLDVPVGLLGQIVIKPPYTSPGILEGLGRFAFGDLRAAGVRAVAVRADDLGAVDVLCGRDHPVAEIVAASSAVPGLFPPVSVGDTAYVDGMMTGSCTNIDLAPNADHLVVIAPMAAPELVGGPKAMAALEAELQRWKARNPQATVEVWTPDARCRELVDRDTDLFDIALAVEVASRAIEQVSRSLSVAA